MSLTLADTPAVSALQLLQQPVLQQQQRLGFLYSKYRIVGKNKCSSFTQQLWSQEVEKWHKSIKYYTNISMKLSGQFHAADKLPRKSLAIMMCG